MSEPYVLTADDILQNKYLRQDGALPGDKIQGNNLIREFSNEGDKREEGYVLTEEDIENNLKGGASLCLGHVYKLDPVVKYKKCS